MGITFAIFAVLNVVAGVFVELALASAQEDRDLVMSEKLLKRDTCVRELRQLFTEVDKDGSGFLSWDEFELLLEDRRVQEYWEAMELDVSEAKGLFSILDVDGTGQVS